MLYFETHFIFLLLLSSFIVNSLFMSQPSATAGDKSISSTSRQPASDRQPASESRPRMSRVESKPPVTMAFNPNERLEATGLKSLSAPGENSNYNYWSFVMQTVIKGSSYGYVLKENQPYPLPPCDDQARCKVSALILRYVDQANIKYLSPHPDDPFNQWKALREAHQNASSGSVMFWLKKLVTLKMGDTNINTHLDSMSQDYQRFKSLVTEKNPLTADTVFATAVSLSLTPDWQPVLQPLLQTKNVTSYTVLKVLREEAVRQSISAEKSETIAAAKNKGKESVKDEKVCTHCGKTNHLIDDCRTLKAKLERYKLLKAEKAEAEDVKSKPSKNQLKQSKAAKAKAAAAISYASSDSEKSIDINSEISTAATIKANSTKTNSWLIDSGTSQIMSPLNDVISSKKPDDTIISIANGTTVKSLSKGFVSLPFSNFENIKSLYVPSLSEPLLSVSKLADKNISTVFNSTGVSFVKDCEVSGDVIETGERRGNLYYLNQKDMQL